MTIDDLHSVAVVGAGTMGSQIAFQVALAGYPVSLFGRSAERLEAAVESATRILRKRVEKGKLSSEELDTCVARVTTGTDLEAATAEADLVIKTIAEDHDAKHQLFTALGRITRPDAILASNSSTMATSFFSACVPNPARLLNLHFFNPALLMPLVEVVKGPHTDDAVVDTCMVFARRIGKSPVLVRKESYGFIANRILFIAMQEAFQLVERGVVGIEDCDLAVKGGLNWPMGPFALADLVGLDVTADILTQGALQTGDPRWQPTPVLTDRVAAGDLGRKTGRGFYEYPTTGS